MPVLCVQWFSQLFVLLALSFLHLVAVFAPARFRDIKPRDITTINISILLVALLLTGELLYKTLLFGSVLFVGDTLLDNGQTLKIGLYKEITEVSGDRKEFSIFSL